MPLRIPRPSRCCLPARTTKYVGTTMIGQASAKVSSDTNRVSPAPRRANENVTLIESAREYTATHKSRLGTMAATAAKLADVAVSAKC